ncbi:MAG: O-antigen ligase family protein [Myxococcota bacterium]
MILVVITAGLFAHLLVLLTARRINPMFMFAAAFLVLAPLSTSLELPHAHLIKYPRIYCSVLMVAIGLFYPRAVGPGSASVSFLGFAIFYWAAGLWSDEMLYALGYKGFFLAAAFAGVLMARTVRDTNDFAVGVRCLGLAGVVFIVMMVTNFLINPAAISHVGRLAAFGINPNTIGQTAALMLIIGFSIALYDRSLPWRWIGFGSLVVLFPLIVYTGSRASAGMAAVGALVLLKPFVRRPGVLFSVFGMLALVGWVLFSTLDQQIDTQRFSQLDTQTRESWWLDALDHFRSSPVIGTGWLYLTTPGGAPTTQSVLSAWLQILVETGVLGVGILLISTMVIAVRFIIAGRAAKRDRSLLYASGVGSALLYAIVAHAFFESSMLIGSASNPLLFGFAVGLVDRLAKANLPAEEVPPTRGPSWSPASAALPSDPLGYPASAAPRDSQR